METDTSASVNTTSALIQTDTSVGLSSQQVLQSRALHGANALKPPLREPAWKKFLSFFDDPCIKILLGAAAISLLMAVIGRFILNGEAHFVDGVGILVAVFLATVVAFINERKSDREFEILNAVKDAIQAKVTRDGQFQTIPIQDVVVGDIVHLDLGDKVPSDGMMISSIDMYVDESLLTGESEPVAKSTDEKSDAQLNDSQFLRNKVYRGTMVVDGHGRFITTAVGDQTEMGKIAGELGEDEEDTPLKQKLTVLAGQISLGGYIAALFIFSVMAIPALLRSEIVAQLASSPTLAIASAIGSFVLALLIIWKSRDFLADKMDVSPKMAAIINYIPIALGVFTIFAVVYACAVIHRPELARSLFESYMLCLVVAVTVVVVAVPEGLPMMVNVSLALNMRKMAKENCLVRKLMASETVGSATVICTDKTGTLTQNQMKPVWFFFGGRDYSMSNIHETSSIPEWNQMVRNIAINSTGNLEDRHGRLCPVGNPTECALLTLLHERGLDYSELREVHPAVKQVHFSSERKQMVTVVAENSHHSCYIKGAPDQIIANCTHISVDGNHLPMDSYRETVMSALQEAAGTNALRVIAFSEKLCDGNDCKIDDCTQCGHRTLMGLVGIADPLRSEVPEAIAICEAAGIEVKMVTGDDPRIAESIARQCNMLHEGDLLMTSSEFGAVPESELENVVSRLRVLARSRPLDKLKLVQRLRSMGYVVAVTGDGTNDAPALKAADVGLSMGIAGTEVAKEASDIVLLDDNFQSIITGVRWGRALYENIQRFLQFQLSVNVVALLCALIGPMVGVPLPLTVPQLLWINIIMDTFAALALSTDPPRERAMKQPPVSRNAHIITPSMAVTILISSLFQVGVLITLMLTNFLGGDTELERLTIFFTVFVMFQFWHKFNCRSLRHDESPFQKLFQNGNFLFIVGLITFVQVAMVQIGGPISSLFRTTPLHLETWGRVMLLTASILPVAWVARQVAFLVVSKKLPTQN